jgi:acyl-[acyl-carrier-protein]-phospholipid O-acyltransferase/long-chain-fatty-acid--[acyl-carrier-protein] ligase
MPDGTAGRTGRPVLSYAAARARADSDRRTLGRALLHHVRRRPRHPAVIDAQGTLSQASLAGAALALLPYLGLADDERTVGVLLPAGRGGAVVNVALAFAGRTTVNLNHTVGEAQLARMIDLAGIRTVITAERYLERIERPTLPGRLVLVDELLPKIPKYRLALAAARALLLPSSLVDKARPDDLATIIFSSGSTAEPKGIMLNHRQILANTDAIVEHLDLSLERDVVLSPLPLFHSFGQLPGLWLGLVNGVTVAAQADPMDGAALGQLAARSHATFLISTPTFVRGYMRRVTKEQFATLRFAVVGAEKCPADLRVAFRAQYDKPLLEGYGATELGPAAAVNLPERQRDGSVGQPLPGVEVFTVDPDTLAPLPGGAEGVLAVRTAACMTGYLHRAELTERAFLGDAYHTGDMGWVDGDGYLYITGRLARFAKVAGEMVPLDLVEELLQAYATTRYGPELGVAVAAVPDLRRGERLVVLHTGLPGEPEEWLAALDGQPNLFKPRPKDFHVVPAIPVLGTGKRDLGGVKALAARYAATSPDEAGELRQFEPPPL